MTCKIGYGFDKNKNLVHISEVESGKNCGVFSIVDGSKLTARKGNINQHHFAHSVDIDFLSYKESLIHILAKQIISEEKSILIKDQNLGNKVISSIEFNPFIRNILMKNYNVTIIEKDSCNEEFLLLKSLIYGELLKFETIELEKIIKYENAEIIPDIIGYFGTSKIQFFIEIAVTHKCDEKKISLLNKMGVISYEININIEDELLLLPPLEIKKQIKKELGKQDNIKLLNLSNYLQEEFIQNYRSEFFEKIKPLSRDFECLDLNFNGFIPKDCTLKNKYKNAKFLYNKREYNLYNLENWDQCIYKDTINELNNKYTKQSIINFYWFDSEDLTKIYLEINNEKVYLSKIELLNISYPRFLRIIIDNYDSMLEQQLSKEKLDSCKNCKFRADFKVKSSCTKEIISEKFKYKLTKYSE